MRRPPMRLSLRHAAVLAAGGALLLLHVGGMPRHTDSAFSAGTENGGNSFQAVADFDLCPGAGTVTAHANADSWLDQNSSTSNFGSDTILKVRAQSGGNAMRAIVRFHVPPKPPGCDVTAATLRLYAASSSAGRTLQALELAAPWTENGVTWTSQPATAGAAATTASGSGWRSWDVTGQLADGPPPHGYLIRDATETGSGQEQQFRARDEGSNPPELQITYG
jgi:large repetitive protein